MGDSSIVRASNRFGFGRLWWYFAFGMAAPVALWFCLRDSARLHLHELTGDAHTINVQLGYVRPGATAETTVAIRNSGKSRWNVKSVSSECSCTAQKLARSDLEPGNEVPMHITFHAPQSSSGVFRKRIFVSFHESDAPLYLIVVSGQIRAWATASPNILDFGDVLAGSTSTRRIEVVAHRPEPLDVGQMSLHWNNATFAAINQSSSSDNLISHSDFEVTFRPPAETAGGQMRGTLNVRSDASPSAEELSIPLVANVRGPIEVDNDQFFFGFVKVGTVTSRAIHYAIHPLASKELSDPDSYTLRHDMGDALKLTARRDDSNGIVVDAILTPKGSEGAIIGTVDVSVPGLPTFHHRVSALIGATTHAN